MSSTRQGWMSIIREATAGVAVKPTTQIPYKEGDFTPKIEITPNNPIKANRWNALNVVQGKTSAEGDHTFDFDPTFAPFFLGGLLGTHTVTTVSSDTSAYKHSMAVNQAVIPSFTVEQMKGGIATSDTYKQGYQVVRAFGTYFDSIELSASDGVVSMNVKSMCLGIFQSALLKADVTAGSTKSIVLDNVEGIAVGDLLNVWKNTPTSEQATVTSVTPATKTVVVATLANPYTVALKSKVDLVPVAASFPDDDVIFSFFHCKFQEGVDITAAASAGLSNVEDWTISLMNNMEERTGSLRQSASVIAPKGAGATIKYTKYFTDVTKRDQWRAVLPNALILTITNDQIISATDTNSTKYSLVLKFPKVVITSYEMPTGTDELYAESIEAEVFYDRVAGYAVLSEVTNGKAAAYYGV